MRRWNAFVSFDVSKTISPVATDTTEKRGSGPGVSFHAWMATPSRCPSREYPERVEITCDRALSRRGRPSRETRSHAPARRAPGRSRPERASTPRRPRSTRPICRPVRGGATREPEAREWRASSRPGCGCLPPPFPTTARALRARLRCGRRPPSGRSAPSFLLERRRPVASDRPEDLGAGQEPPAGNRGRQKGGGPASRGPHPFFELVDVFRPAGGQQQPSERQRRRAEAIGRERREAGSWDVSASESQSAVSCQTVMSVSEAGGAA